MIHAIVTGHSRGLGQALAADLLARGARVLGLSRGGHAGLAAAHPDHLQQVALDLSDTAALSAWLGGPMLARWVAGARTVLLLNNAGLVSPIGPPGRQGACAIADAVSLNVTTPLMLTDALVATLAALAAHATHPAPAVDCRVVHLSSGAARNAYPGWSVYCATKAALDMHALAVAQDAVPGLRVASVAPGVIDTGMQADIRAAQEADFPQRSRFEALHREGQLAEPTDVARRLLDHLLSPAFGTPTTPDLRNL